MPGGGGLPGTEAAFVLMCHLMFDSVESFMAAFAPHAAVFQSDLKNYSDNEPAIQVNEVLVSRRLFATQEMDG